MPAQTFSSKYSVLFYLTGNRKCSLGEARQISYIAFSKKGGYHNELSLSEVESAIAAYNQKVESAISKLNQQSEEQNA